MVDIEGELKSQWEHKVDSAKEKENFEDNV